MKTRILSAIISGMLVIMLAASCSKDDTVKPSTYHEFNATGGLTPAPMEPDDQTDEDTLVNDTSALLGLATYPPNVK